MKEFKGTLGVWQVNESKSHQHATYVYSGETRIAEVKHYKEDEGDVDFPNDPLMTEGLSNAKAISAVPDMIKALSKVLEDIEVNDLHEYVDYVGLVKVLNKALR